MGDVYVSADLLAKLPGGLPCMTTPTPLAKRATACPGWEWLPGMLIGVPGADGNLHELIRLDEDVFTGPPRADLVWVPDLTDPATLGCLLWLVRRAWGDNSLHAFILSDGRWVVESSHLREASFRRCLPCTTEAEALVAALEAAPLREAKARWEQEAPKRAATMEAAMSDPPVDRVLPEVDDGK